MNTSWIDRIEEAKKHEESWRKDAVKAVQKYRGKHKAGLNVLWPNTELKRAALFARLPKPVVKRRFGRNLLSSQTSLMIERVIQYNMDTQAWFQTFEDAVLDAVLPGRCVVRLRYRPRYREREEPVDTDEMGNFFAHGEPVTQDMVEIRNDEVFFVHNELMSEHVIYEHVPWPDFCLDPTAERWVDVRWIAFHHVMSPEAAKRDFGARNVAAKIAEVQGNRRREQSGATDNDKPTHDKQLSVWEVWDKEKKKVHFVTENHSRASQRTVTLKTYDDPTRLQEFFPTPEPLRSVRTPGTLSPVTEYSLYESLAVQVDELSRRIGQSIKRLVPKGIYDASMREALANVARSDETFLHPVSNWMAVAESRAKGGMIEWFPFKEFVDSVSVMEAELDQKLQRIYEVTGLSDILRGSTDARETATAQKIKSQFGGLRLQPFQASLQRYIRSCMEIEAELIAEHYEIDTIAAIAQMEPPEGMEQLLRSDVARQFSIDIETDSTIAMDDAQEKQDRTEFLQVFSNTLANSAEAVNAGLFPQEALARFIEFAVQPWRVGRELEEVIDNLAQPKPQPPDAAAQAAQAKAAIAQSELMLKAQKHQDDMNLDSAKLQLDSEKVRLEDQREREKMFIDALKATA